MSLPENPRFITGHERNQLLGIAIISIRSGLQGNGPPQPGSVTAKGYLAERRATFVTLKRGDMLRGCIGSLEAHTTLADDVCRNAWAAAFRDPRFQPVQDKEFQMLSVQISVLGKPELIDFGSERDLISKLRPGVDGLIFREKTHTGTFLPSVWESINEPAEFLQQLKLKAGLAPDYWSNTVAVWSYTTESFATDISAFMASNRYYLTDTPR